MIHLGFYVVFHVGISYKDFFKALGFLWLAPRVFRVSLGMHKRIRLSFSDSLGFHVRVSVGFHVGLI